MDFQVFYNNMNLKYFKKIVEFYKTLPGVGEKTAERYAFSMLNMPVEQLSEFSNIINNLDQYVNTCSNCGCLMENNKCFYCNSDKKNINTICVVENQKNVFTFEKLGFSDFKYHVLGGLISPMKGVNPSDINILSLIKRIEIEKPKEIIIALKSGVEASTTALYLKKILKDKNIKITQIAQGVPIGLDMEYLDQLTLELALENRGEVE